MAIKRLQATGLSRGEPFAETMPRLVFLLLAAVAVGNSEKVFEFGPSQTLLLSLESNYNKISNCQLRTNTGEVHQYNPRDYSINERIYVDSQYSCSLFVREADIKDAGRWKITETEISDDGFEVSKDYEFKAIFVKQAKLVPASSVDVYEDYYVISRMDDDLEGLTSCTATDPQGNVTDLLAEKMPRGIERFGECGLRLHAQKIHNGQWKLVASMGEFVRLESSLRLDVHKQLESSNEMKTIRLVRGRKGKITVGPQSQFCQLEDSQSHYLPLIRGSCNYVIPLVTAQHEGVWAAHYAVNGRLHMHAMLFRIETYESERFKTNVTMTKDGGIKMTCQVDLVDQEDFGFCRFIRPDGVTLNMSPGVGDERYVSLQVPYIHYTYNQFNCSLLIQKPEAVDYGTWRCVISSSTGDLTTGTVFNVLDSTSAAILAPRRPIISAQEVYVKRGDKFTVMCRANMALGYCWLQSPNGTQYSVSFDPKSRPAFSLPYKGTGLLYGDCGGEVEAAEASDNGQWTCGLGIINGSEEKVSVSVAVSESYMMTSEPVVPVYQGVGGILSCRLIPYVFQRSIQYCRWIRPDGYGVYNEADRYKPSSDRTWCRLSIESVQPEDIGRWRCVAGLRGYHLEEAWTTVDVRQAHTNYGILVGLAVSACLLLALLISALVLINMRRRRRLEPEKPPAYETAIGAATAFPQDVYLSKEHLGIGKQ